MDIAEEAVAEVQAALLSWFDATGRRLPWRETADGYAILVSEVMLQQTQVDRVIPVYHAFLRRFPTFESLADAPAGEVIRAWAGMGYNRRALNLQRAAQAVVERHGGALPTDPKALRSLPGVGEYTANALACFAQGRQVAVVDTNVRRVLGRVFHWPSTPTDREVAATAERVLPEGKAWAWNQALMDLGATVCTSRRPTCLLCPVRAACRAAGAFEAEAAPAVGRGGAGWVSGEERAVRGVQPVLPWAGRGAPARACRGGVVRAGRAGRCRAARILGGRRAVAARGAGGPCTGRARRGARRGGLDAGQPAVATREASAVAGGHGCVYHSGTWQLGRVDPRR